MHEAARFPEDPYPGANPGRSYVLDEGSVLLLADDGPLHLRTVAAAEPAPLPGWLAAHGHAGLEGRRPVLSYGSNACPAKLVAMRGAYGLAGPVVLTRCTVTGLAAAWCAGTRLRDGAVPATVVAAAGREEHFLWWATDPQLDAADRWEGAPDRYELVDLAARFPGARVDPHGAVPSPPILVYVGRRADRRPLLDAAGAPLLVRDVRQRPDPRDVVP